MKLFTRETLKHSIKPIIIVIIACTLVWYWGNYRKVSVELTLRPDLKNAEAPVRLDMTVYRGDNDVAATFATPLASDRLAVQHLDLRPGNYMLRGIITTQSGKTHIVSKNIIIPEENASIEVYLRNER